MSADLREETAAYHALALALENNYRALTRLRESSGSWSQGWEKLSRESGRSSARASSRPLDALEKIEAQGIRCLLATDPDFPKLLTEIPWPPHALYVRGTIPSVIAPSIAIVGTRRATPEGARAAHDFGRSCAGAGMVVISGLAFGVDAAAHRGALEGRGITCAVLATGLDTVYPHSHHDLADTIVASQGALLSEYAPGTPALPHRFLERNRIIAGLSRGILIVEAPARSGALATARFATEQNRDVFVLPGPHHHRNFEGSHELIRNGATLVTRPEQIFEAWGLDTAHRVATPAPLLPNENLIVNVLAHAETPLPVDKIAELTNLNTRTVQQTASYLIIKKIIAENDSGYSLIS